MVVGKPRELPFRAAKAFAASSNSPDQECSSDCRERRAESAFFPVPRCFKVRDCVVQLLTIPFLPYKGAAFCRMGLGGWEGLASCLAGGEMAG